MPSPSPRNRSRSPRPSKPASSSSAPKNSGFRWKEKPRRDAEVLPRDTKRLERGYRDREDDYDRRRRERDSRDDSSRRDGDRGDDWRRERRDRDDDDKRRRGDDVAGHVARKDVETIPAPSMTTTTTETKTAPQPPPPQQQQTADDLSIASKFGPSFSSNTATTTSHNPSTNNTSSTLSSSTTTTSRAPAPSATGPMIIIKINDRLGTTTKVPCLASDSIGDLKKLVAMRIGRKPHEIMLKRQSERPFKDFLTLSDYGVSDGVQLDLEIDTGG